MIVNFKKIITFFFVKFVRLNLFCLFKNDNYIYYTGTVDFER